MIPEPIDFHSWEASKLLLQAVLRRPGRKENLFFVPAKKNKRLPPGFGKALVEHHLSLPQGGGNVLAVRSHENWKPPAVAIGQIWHLEARLVIWNFLIRILPGFAFPPLHKCRLRALY